MKTERMSTSLKDKCGDTVRLQRPPPRVITDACGRNIWMGEIEPLDLVVEEASNADPYNSADIAGRLTYLVD